MNTQSQNIKSMTIIRSGLHRPNWICRNVHQNVVLVRDASGSMNGQKANDASAASLDLVAELAQPINKDGFNVAVVDFSETSKIVHAMGKATEANGKIAALSTNSFGGSTNITSGLENALLILDTPYDQSNEGISYLRPVVILFTDGCHNEGPPPNAIADRLKQKADLVTVAFGDDADEDLMRKLATSLQHFYRCATGRDLRSFLAAVGATMTATMAAGTNATRALGTINQ